MLDTKAELRQTDEKMEGSAFATALLLRSSWLAGCFGCANSRLSSVIMQKQMYAKYRTPPGYQHSNDNQGLLNAIKSIDFESQPSHRKRKS